MGVKRSALLLWVGLLLIAGSAALIGAVHTKIYGHDIFVLLDNGWRVLNGQRPHVDYDSPFGPVGFLIAALGLALSGGSVNGIGIGSALFSLAVGVWCYFAARHRLTPALLTVTCLFLTALVAAPYPLGLTPFDSSHAMVYNRYGYALLGLVLIGGGVSTGIALALALFLKASYFAAGLGLVLVSFFFKPFGRTAALRMVLGFSFVSLLLLWYLHFDVPAITRDLSMAAGARAASFGPSIIFAKTVPLASTLLAIVLFGWVVSGHIRLPLIGALVFGADILLLASNSQSAGLPLVAITAILFLNELRPAPAAVIAFGAILFVPQFASDLTGLAYGAYRMTRSAEVTRFTAPRLQPLMLFESNSDPESNGREFTTYVNDGVALLQREASPRDKVLTMDMTNPFPYALGWQPPRGGIASATFNVTLSEEHHPSAQEYFGDADIVMVPKQPAHEISLWDAFFRLYSPELTQRYSLRVESERWRLWRKK